MGYTNNFILENIVSHDFNSDTFYCYMLIDPTTSEPFYVGKGKRYRFKMHVYPCHTRNNTHKHRKIQKTMRESGHYIARIVFTTPDENQAYQYEQYLISQYPHLTNVAVGGPWYPSKPTRKVVQYNLYGEVVATHDSYLKAADAVDGDDNTAKQILECCRGATPTCADYYWSYEGEKIIRVRTKIRPIRQLTIDGNIITRYVSLAEAGRCLNIDGRDIARAIRRNGTCAGFKWEYIEVA